MTRSLQVMRATQLAREVLAPRFAKKGCSVAITGSVARGDAGAGSDLDLWVIGKQSGRAHFVESGVPVTLLRQTLKEALAFENLCYFEVADLQVLCDAAGHFEKIQRVFARRKAEIRKAVVEATLADFRFELTRGSMGSTWSQVMYLRAAGFRLGALWLFKHTGWRVPRVSTLRTNLPPAAWRALKGLLALPTLPAHFFRKLQGTASRVDRWLRAASLREAISGSVRAQLPREVLHKWRSGEPEEVVWLMRKELTQTWLPALLEARGAHDVANLTLADIPRGVCDLFVELQGLKSVTPWDTKSSARAHKQLHATADALGLATLLQSHR